MILPSLNWGGVYLPSEGSLSESLKKIRTKANNSKLASDKGIIGNFLFVSFLIK